MNTVFSFFAANGVSIFPITGFGAIDAGGGATFSWQAWAGFFALVATVLAFDLGVFQQLRRRLRRCRCLKNETPPATDEPAQEHKIEFGAALRWSLFQFALAAIFCTLLFAANGAVVAETFAAGYLMELALSVDNLFVFLLVFSAFSIPETLQHRVLFWGILGALVMRAGFILGGVALLEYFSWLMLVFGAFLIASAVKLLLPHKDEENLSPEKNIFVRLAKKLFPVTQELHGHHFLIRDSAGKLAATPLLLALIVIEGSDVIFAVDSIPAVMGVIPRSMPYDAKLFIAFTSNIFAILGLRSLFFVLAGFLRRFWLLKYGLALILGFIGVKMCIAEIWEIHLTPALSLGILAATLTLTISLSLAITPTRSSGQ